MKISVILCMSGLLEGKHTALVLVTDKL